MLDNKQMGMNKNMSPIIRDVMAIRSENRAADIDVRDVIAGYIAPGMAEHDARNTLKLNNFEIESAEINGRRYLLAKNHRPKNLLGFGDDIDVALEIKDGNVFNINAHLRFRAF